MCMCTSKNDYAVDDDDSGVRPKSSEVFIESWKWFCIDAPDNLLKFMLAHISVRFTQIMFMSVFALTTALMCKPVVA